MTGSPVRLASRTPETGHDQHRKEDHPDEDQAAWQRDLADDSGRRPRRSRATTKGRRDATDVLLADTGERARGQPPSCQFRREPIVKFGNRLSTITLVWPRTGMKVGVAVPAWERCASGDDPADQPRPICRGSARYCNPVGGKCDRGPPPLVEPSRQVRSGRPPTTHPAYHDGPPARPAGVRYYKDSG